MAEYTYICKAVKTAVSTSDPFATPAGDFNMTADKVALYQFEAIPEVVNRQVIKSVKLIFQVKKLRFVYYDSPAHSINGTFCARDIWDTWSESITKEQYDKLDIFPFRYGANYIYTLIAFKHSPITEYEIDHDINIYLGKSIPKNGLEFGFENYDSSHGTEDFPRLTMQGLRSARSDNPPYLEIICEDSVPEVTLKSPLDVYVDVTTPVTFSWEYSDPANNPQSKWYLYARKDTEEDNWTTIATGEDAATSCVIPENTFDLIEKYHWRVMVKNDQGILKRSSVSTFMARPVPSATILQPKGGFVDASVDTAFRWNYFNPIGDEQAKYTIETSVDGIEWAVLAEAESAETYYIAPANTLTYNIKHWRVWVTNRQGIQSESAATATITVIAAPACEITSVSRTPQPVVNWKATVQRGYQVQIGDHDSGPIYGTASSYKCPVYLPDGPAETRVRVVNEYGLWSRWATATVDIVNKPGSPVHLNATATHRSALKWDGPPGEYVVLRDGKEIATVQGSAYTDELAVGRHIYQVHHAWAGDYYTLSNEISVEMRPRYPMISAVENIDWLELRLSTTATPTVNISRSREVYFAHYSGRRLPVAETGGFDTEILTFSAAFRDPDKAKKLLALSGRKVCYKDPRGNIIIGVLEGLSGGMGRMYGELSGTIVATEETT